MTSVRHRAGLKGKRDEIEAARAQCENKKCLSYHLYKEMERNGEKTFYIRVRYRRTSG